MLGPEDHRQAFASDDPAVRARLGSVGQPLPTLELEIRDPDGNPLPAGQSGEIYVRGEQVAGEYLGRDSVMEDGWFPTRDGGFLDEDGFLYLTGRLDDIIVRGAENISSNDANASAGNVANIAAGFCHAGGSLDAQSAMPWTILS